MLLNHPIAFTPLDIVAVNAIRSYGFNRVVYPAENLNGRFGAVRPEWSPARPASFN